MNKHHIDKEAEEEGKGGEGGREKKKKAKGKRRRRRRRRKSIIWIKISTSKKKNEEQGGLLAQCTSSFFPSLRILKWKQGRIFSRLLCCAFYITSLIIRRQEWIQSFTFCHFLPHPIFPKVIRQRPHHRNEIFKFRRWKKKPSFSGVTNCEGHLVAFYFFSAR